MSNRGKGKGVKREQATTHLVRLSSYAYNRLWKARDAFQQEVHARPDLHPIHAGRRVTLSDLVVALTEAKQCLDI